MEKNYSANFNSSIVITGFIGIFFGLLIANVSLIHVILLFATFIILLFFLSNSKTIVYFLVIIFPLLPLIYSHTTLQGENTYSTINVSGILNVGVIIIGLCVLLFNKFKLSQYKLAIPLISFLGVTMLSILFSPEKFLSLRQWFRYAMPAMVYFIVLNSFSNSKEVKVLLKFTLLSFIPSVVLGILQLILKNISYIVYAKGIEFNRIVGSFAHPSTFAMILVVFLLLTVFFISESKKSFLWIYLVFFITMLVSLISTYTRVGWAAFLTAICIAGFLKYRKPYFLFLLAGVFSLLLLPNLAGDLAIRILPDKSFWGRFDLNRLGISFFMQSPIFGHGVGSYVILSEQFTGIISTAYGVSVGLAPHNDYIRFLAEGGIFGITAYLFLMFSALKQSVLTFKATDATIKNYGVFMISLIVAILVFGITDQGFEYAGFYFWLFLAIGEIYYREWNQESLKQITG